MDMFLGEPPANIKAWIIAHHNPGPAGHAETIFTFTNNRIANKNISGTLENLWKWDEDSGNDFLDYEGPEKLFMNDLVSVDIGNTVESIGMQAFLRCFKLTNVIIPNSVTSIGYAAFSGCFKLMSVTIGNKVENIEEEAFFGCDELMSVTFLGKTMQQVKDIEDSEGNKYYPWGIEDTNIINVG